MAAANNVSYNEEHRQVAEPPVFPPSIERRQPSEFDGGDDRHTPLTWPVQWRLYVSHFLSTWNSRSFEFASVLFLAHIYPDTLLYLSIYAIVRSASAIFLSPAIGRAIDKHGRLPIVRSSISASLQY